jgi:hypothetical protein
MWQILCWSKTLFSGTRPGCQYFASRGPQPHLQVGNYALKGASGGGAFWNGYHVGNVWAHNLEVDPVTGEVARLYTLIALNAESVAALN